MNSPQRSVAEGRVYTLPSISVIVSDGSDRADSIIYVGKTKAAKWAMFTAIFSNFLGFIIAVLLLAIPVTVTSILLINTISSQGIIAVKTQEVPTNKEIVYVPTPSGVSPATK